MFMLYTSFEMENSHVLENLSTKERSTNFTKAEVDKLQSLVGKYKHIILCKKTDGTSSKQKENAWNNISKEFNAVGDTPRTVKQLKYKFDNLKRAIKKEASSKRQSMIKTGGGRVTPSLPPTQDDEETTDWFKSIMSTSIDGNDAIYDDVIKPHEDENIKLDIITIKDSNNSIVKVAESKTAEPAGNEPEIVFDTSTPHSSLKRPMSSPLKRWAKRRRDVQSCNIVKKVLQEKKLNVLDELHDIELLKKIKCSIEQQRELHEQKIKHNEEKHKLEIIKLQLKIDLLRNK